MENYDQNRAWFTIRSQIIDRKALSLKTGIPEPIPNSLGRLPIGKSLSIHSDNFISCDCPIDDHVKLLLKKISENSKLNAAIRSHDFDSSIMIYIMTSKDCVRTNLAIDLVEKIYKTGCDLEFKVEFYQ